MAVRKAERMVEMKADQLAEHWAGLWVDWMAVSMAV
jgi:hypothetical protein